MRKIASLLLMAVSAASLMAQGSPGGQPLEALYAGELSAPPGDWAPARAAPGARVLAFDRAAIEASGASDLAGLLAGAPGVAGGSYGYPGGLSSVSVRGAAGSQLLVIVDGVRLNDARSGGADLSALRLDEVERVELLPAGASALYGSDAAAGVLYVVTRRPAPGAELYAQASASPAAPGADSAVGIVRLGASGSVAAGGAVLRASAGAEYAPDKQAALSGGRAIERANAGLAAFDASAAAAWASFGGSAEASAALRYADKGAPGAAAFPSEEAEQRDRKLRARLAWSRDDLADGELAVAFGASLRLDRLEYVDPAWSQDDRHDGLYLGGEGRAELFLGAHTLRAGTVASFERADSSAVGRRSRPSLGAYAAPELRFGGFVLAPSLRLDWSGDFDAGLSWAASAGYTDGRYSFGASASSAYRAPGFNDLYWPDEGWGKGNPGLRPERSFGAELSFAYAEGGFALSLSPYGRYVFDAIRWVDPDGWMGPLPMSPTNVDESAYIGAEASFAYRAGPWSAALSYAALEARSLGGEASFKDAPRLGGTARHSGGLSLAYAAGAFSVAAEVKALIDRVASDGAEADDALIASARAAWSPSPRLRLELKLENLLNVEYEERSGYPMPGLTATLGARYRL